MLDFIKILEWDLAPCVVKEMFEASVKGSLSNKTENFN